MNNQDELLGIAQQNLNVEAQILAFRKLTEPTLQRTISSSTDQTLLIATKIRLRQYDWDQAFLDLRQSGTYWPALRAARLVLEPHLSEVTILDEARYLIRLGDEGRIPELRELLFMSKNELLAENYLNCGHPALAKMAQEWASRNGFKTVKAPGNPRILWPNASK